MNAPFDSLTRNRRYKFALISGEAFTATFHEYLPDGTLKVTGSPTGFPGDDSQGHLNPAAIAIAWELKRA